MKYIGHLDKHSPGVAEMCEETRLSISDGQATEGAQHCDRTDLSFCHACLSGP